MNQRETMKGTLRFLFELLNERGVHFEQYEIEKAVQIMHDDSVFLDELLDFFEEHIDIFGENYGL